MNAKMLKRHFSSVQIQFAVRLCRCLGRFYLAAATAAAAIQWMLQKHMRARVCASGYIYGMYA